jgi:hypothetical protein
VVTEEKLFLPGAEELKEEGAAAGGAKGLKTLLLEQNVQEKEVNNDFGSAFRSASGSRYAV